VWASAMMKPSFADEEALQIDLDEISRHFTRGLARDRWNYFEERSIRATSSSLDITSAYCTWILRSDSQY
jgi:hypothetical protein